MEKKIYEQPIIEVTKFDNEDVITTSTHNVKYDPFNLLDDPKGDSWFS